MREIQVAVALAFTALLSLSACDDKTGNKSEQNATSADTAPTTTTAQDLTNSLTADLNTEMQTLGTGGSSSNIELTSYLGSIGGGDGNGMETPDWSHPVDVIYSEYGGSRITATDQPDPTVILYVKLHTGTKDHSFAYIGHFTEKGVIFRHEVTDLDPGDAVIAAWKKSWFFSRR